MISRMVIQVVLSIAVINVFAFLSANGYYLSRDMSTFFKFNIFINICIEVNRS